MLNFNELFPSIYCANKFLNFKSIFGETSISQVIGDTGPTQDQIATLLPGGTTCFVNSTTHPAIPYLYKYAKLTGSPLNLHHFVSPGAVTNNGDCLSVTASDGQLQFQGSPCEDELTPLCYRTFDNLTTAINSTCGQTSCSSLSEYNWCVRHTYWLCTRRGKRNGYGYLLLLTMVTFLGLLLNLGC